MTQAGNSKTFICDYTVKTFGGVVLGKWSNMSADLKFSGALNPMNLLNRGLDRRVRSSLSEDKLELLEDAVEDAPVVPKYDPEDYDPEQLSEEEEEAAVDEMADIISHPLVEAVQIGGSYDVNADNVGKTLELLEEAQDRNGEVFTMLEPGSPADLQSEGQFDFDLLTAPDVINKPYVWNTQDSTWKDGKHSSAQRLLNDLTEERGAEAMVEKVASDVEEKIPGFAQRFVDPYQVAVNYVNSLESPESYIQTGFDNRIVPETYFVVNPDAAVAEKTSAREWLQELGVETPGDAHEHSEELAREAAALAGDKSQDGYDGIIYVEASGTLGPEEAVTAVDDRLNQELGQNQDVLVAYGGGIYDGDDIKTYIEAGADFVFVGNSVQEQGAEALPDPEELEEVI
jgi:heptaprenylglyceryl phosphate synthase